MNSTSKWNMVLSLPFTLSLLEQSKFHKKTTSYFLCVCSTYAKAFSHWWRKINLKISLNPSLFYSIFVFLPLLFSKKILNKEKGFLFCFWMYTLCTDTDINTFCLGERQAQQLYIISILTDETLYSSWHNGQRIQVAYICSCHCLFPR